MTMEPYARKKARLEQQRKELWGLPVPEGLKHGPPTKANLAYGCNCTKCLPSGRRYAGTTLSTTERGRRLRKNKRGKPVPEGVKHGIYPYRVYRCRCDFCVHAHRLQGRRKRERLQRKREPLRRQPAVGFWSVRGDNDVLHWPPAGEGPWTCPDCSQVFRRREQSDARAA